MALSLDASRSRRQPIDRSGDRLVAMAAISIAIGYLCVAALSALLPVSDRVGSWLPLHLALAGAASTAIAGVMPFFSAAFAAAPPTDRRLRWFSVMSVALGAAALSIGYAAEARSLAAVGGGLFIAGIVLVGIATIRPLGRGLGPKGGLVTRGYVMALGMVALGGALAMLFLAGWQPVVEIWGYLRPAHAWLNLVGFVSLVIATTLLHFFPTVIGARIKSTRSARATVAGLASGAPLVALGFALRSDLVARSGAVLVAVGSVSLAVYCAQVWRTRADWTTDASWHLFAMGALVSAIAWFEAGMLAAAGRLFVAGADPTATSTEVLIGPLVIGWIGLALLGSATHLVPAVGPGDPAAHARQRRILGHGAAARLVAANVGIASVAVGIPSGFDVLIGAGIALVTAALATTAILVIWAVATGLRNVQAR